MEATQNKFEQLVEKVLEGIIDHSSIPTTRFQSADCAVLLVFALFDEYFEGKGRVAAEVTALVDCLANPEDNAVSSLNVEQRSLLWNALNIIRQRKRQLDEQGKSGSEDGGDKAA